MWLFNHHNMSQLIILCFLMLVFLFEVGVILSFIKILKVVDTNAKTALQLFELDMSYKNAPSVENIDAELDSFISVIFSNYIYRTRYNSFEQVTSEEELTMCNEMIDEVYTKISKTFLLRILQVYNKDKIHDIINDKIIILVARFASECNSPKK